MCWHACRTVHTAVHLGKLLLIDQASMKWGPVIEFHISLSNLVNWAFSFMCKLQTNEFPAFFELVGPNLKAFFYSSSINTSVLTEQNM